KDSTMSFHVVLVHPLIPQNTGNIARLTAATGCYLHVIEPLAFEISDRQVKRAGLDYWPEVKLTVHPSWDAFLESQQITATSELWFFTKKATASYHRATFKAGCYLVYGNESEGLPEAIHAQYQERRLLIPMDNPNIRSLNLSNAVALTLFEARRQCGMLDR
ncbi:MAG: tRNA (cytidine(34)-2'-O)-methyltransferase, partial [Bdellovibrionales bacterium]|nr:tRNA (cytidine(34)-2'-O)-methyltransferase [Bdellovibrionales bacterium]